MLLKIFSCLRLKKKLMYITPHTISYIACILLILLMYCPYIAMYIAPYIAYIIAMYCPYTTMYITFILLCIFALQYILLIYCLYIHIFIYPYIYINIHIKIYSCMGRLHFVHSSTKKIHNILE
jgi:hypothetical protein